MKVFRRTPRGFADFTEFKDRYGSTITVRESSLATEACVWIFCQNEREDYKNPSPHLTRHQAQMLIKALENWLEYTK